MLFEGEQKHFPEMGVSKIRAEKQHCLLEFLCPKLVIKGHNYHKFINLNIIYDFVNQIPSLIVNIFSDRTKLTGSSSVYHYFSHYS
jgi:hypothetical protein